MYLRTIFSVSLLFGAAATAAIPFDSKTFRLSEHDTSIPTTFKDYKSWILAKKPQAQKEALIENTILNVHFPITPKIKWAKASMTDQDFDALLKNPVASVLVTVTAVKGIYRFTPNGAYWVDFANARTFGGGFRTNGNVQEERLFMEFPQLAELAFAKRANQILPVTMGCSLPREKPACAEPFLVYDLLRRFDVSAVPYGKDIFRANVNEIPKDIKKLSSPYAQAHIIGLAAMDWCDSKIGTRKYNISDLKYLLKEALLGNLGALKHNLLNGKGTPEVHTGKWGAGAFKNSENMVTAIQILAGAMAQMEKNNATYGINLFIHSIAATLISDLKDQILNKLNEGQTPQDLLNFFLVQQAADPSTWGPEPCPKKTMGE